MFVLEPKSTVKYLAVAEAVISASFLLFLIVLRIHVTTTEVVPNWIVELNFRHWSTSFVTSAQGTSMGFVIVSLLIYYAFVTMKFLLAIFLWRSVPKDYVSRKSRRLLHWTWITILINLVGLGLLMLLNYSGALEVTLAKIFSIMTCLFDLFCVGSVLWLRRVILFHEQLGVGGHGCGTYIIQDARAANGQWQNPNHNLRPCTIF